MELEVLKLQWVMGRVTGLVRRTGLWACRLQWPCGYTGVMGRREYWTLQKTVDMMRSCIQLPVPQMTLGRRKLRNNKASWERHGIVGEAGDDGNDEVLYCVLPGTAMNNGKKGIGKQSIMGGKWNCGRSEE